MRTCLFAYARASVPGTLVLFIYIRIACSIWYFIQFVHIAIFMSLHVTRIQAPAGTCYMYQLELVYRQFEHWPAFTETVQPDSVSKRPDGHNAYKVGVAPPT